MKIKRLPLFTAKLIAVAIIAVMLTAFGGQMYAFLHPSYSNLVLDPDPVIGWKFAPEIEFINTGDQWYAKELSVHHRTNALGFLGPDVPFDKSPGEARIVLMGDSFVEALQVPRELSAAGFLEADLNRRAQNGETPHNAYTVLNLGISNFSVGQYVYLWEEYASRFDPDYVLVFLAHEPLKRTPSEVGDWGVKISRPSFRIKNGKLVRIPVQNHEVDQAAFDEELRRRGSRTERRQSRLFLTDWVKNGDMKAFIKKLIPAQLRMALKQAFLENPTQRLFPALVARIKGVFRSGERDEDAAIPVAPGAKEMEISEETLALNLLVLEELNRKIEKSGARMVIVDASLYFWFLGANEVLTDRLESFARARDIPYIPLYRDLLATDRENIWARFPYSHHFNEHGNRIFARNMRDWLLHEWSTSSER